ncbi:Tetratricopeptide repeat protein 7A [Thelohanellus kitauei]|uniref:Tetratricopeptide repeat protein 7A n=1 Tax=Thelohanellus kitauei TaxID=669202 RepID=A0A0C2MKB6_THEKT|nr:Tetratricopeptide repeat protein 7A [Thelohanellus kitauei]
MKELQEACLSDVLKAISLDDNDSEQYFIASLVYGCMGDLDNALLYAFEASKRSIFDSRPYHMTFLVFVAKNLIDEALRVLADMEHEFPSDFSIILNKVEMDHYLYGPEVALASIKTALETWYQLFNHTFSNLESQEGDDKTTNSLPGRSIIRTIFPRKDNPDTRSVFWLFNTSKTPKFQSQMTFSFFNDIKDSIILLALLLQKMAMIYLELRSYESAKKCIDDIKSLGYVFPEVYLLDAMYHKGIGSVEKYEEYLETALYLNPNHVESLHQLVLFYLEQYDKFDDQKSKLMNLELAEETARHLVKVSPKNFISWQVLGRVLHEMNVDIGESLSCFSRALELKDFVSIIPFKRIVRRLKPNDLNVKTVV